MTKVKKKPLKEGTPLLLRHQEWFNLTESVCSPIFCFDGKALENLNIETDLIRFHYLQENYLPAHRPELVDLECHVLHPVVTVHHRVQLKPNQDIIFTRLLTNDHILISLTTTMSMIMTLKSTPC